MASAQIADDELRCPRCGGGMTRGFIDAGKGPVRWVTTRTENFWILGGEHLVKRRWVWGRQVLPAARCKDCAVGIFVFDQD